MRVKLLQTPPNAKDADMYEVGEVYEVAPGSVIHGTFTNRENAKPGDQAAGFSSVWELVEL